MTRSRRVPALALLGLGLGTTVCTERTARRECLSLLEQKSYPAAVARCTELFERTGDAAAGLAAAKAQHASGADDGVLAWQPRLNGRAEEAELLRLVAEIHGKRGDRAARRNALERRAALHDRAGDPGRASDDYHDLSYAAWQASDYRATFEFGALALDRAVAARDRRRQAAALRSLFAAYYETGDLPSALSALREERALLDPADKEALARHHANEAGLRLDEGRPELARAAAERALELGPTIKSTRFFRTAHINLAVAHLRLGQLTAAESQLSAAERHVDAASGPPVSLRWARARVLLAAGRHREALAELDQAVRSRPSPEWAWDIEYWRGVAHEALGNTSAAAGAYERSMDIVEAMRQGLPLDEMKGWIVQRKREAYEAHFRLRARAGDARAALMTFERATARRFLDAFVRSLATEGSTADAAAGVARTVQRMASLEACLPRVRSSPVVEVRPTDELLRAVGKRHVVAFFRAQGDFWQIVVSGGRLRVRPLKATAAEIQDLGRELARDPRHAAAARGLSDRLLPPGSLPAAGSVVYVVTDEILDGVPLAALRRGERFLTEDYVLSYVPSLNALAALSERPREEPAPPAVLADSRGDLPSAATEARGVARVLNVEPAIGPQATLAALRRAREARVLHLAMHTGVSARGAWLAAADGDVLADAILAERLRPRLVVLATCVSAGARTPGLTGSLAATFLAAGSRSVVATLSSVDDHDARDWTTRFYAMGGGDHSACGLARATRSLIREGREPSSWAPFVHVGLAESESPGIHQKGTPCAEDSRSSPPS